MLGDHRGAVVADFSEWEADVVEVGDCGEERVVAAGRLGAALDDMARHHRAGQPVIVAASPAEVRRGRPDDHRGIGDAAGDDDVGPGVQAVDDSPRTQIGVGGQR